MKRLLQGPLLGMVLLGVGILGTSIWAVSLFPPRVQQMPSVFNKPPIPMPFADSWTDTAPKEILWFFVLYPQVSEKSEILEKNRHSFIVKDKTNDQQYVISWTQKSRRVEIYGKLQPYTIVHLYRPGLRKIVHTQGDKIIRNWEEADPDNQWMWENPLWNKTQLKIYGMAEFWRDSPYKKFSCARFVHQFLKEAGVDVPLQNAWDMAKLPWPTVERDNIEPGDVITFKATPNSWRVWRKSVTHVGVYIGDGKFIHAASQYNKTKKGTVRVASLVNFDQRIDKILRPPELQ